MLENGLYAWKEAKRGREKEKEMVDGCCAKHSVMKVGRFAGRSGEKQRK